MWKTWNVPLMWNNYATYSVLNDMQHRTMSFLIQAYLYVQGEFLAQQSSWARFHPLSCFLWSWPDDAWTFPGSKTFPPLHFLAGLTLGSSGMHRWHPERTQTLYTQRKERRVKRHIHQVSASEVIHRVDEQFIVFTPWKNSVFFVCLLCFCHLWECNNSLMCDPLLVKWQH